MTQVSEIIKSRQGWLTTEQAAEKMGIQKRTLDKWRITKRYIIPFVKIGRLVKYREEVIDSFINSQTITE